jgi:hypothetical protein
MSDSRLRPISLALVAPASLVCAAAWAQGITSTTALHLLARGSNDRVPAQLRAPAPGKLVTADLERAPITVSWALDASQPLTANPAAFVAESREYWIDASQADLQRGLSLALSAPGAVIRLSPHGGRSSATIAVSDVQISVAGRRVDNGVAIRSIASADELSAAGMDAPQGSVALRLSDTIGAGPVQLAVPTANGAYLVHVYEPASSVTLNLGAERDNVSGGEALRIHASVVGANALDRIGGLVSAPDGSSQTITFARQSDGSYLASVVPDVAHAGDRGLWEVHAFAVVAGRVAIPRDAKSAFSVSVPVARLDGSVERSVDKAGSRDVAVQVGVESVAASRYQVSAVLYGTASDGALKPAVIAQSAAWLGVGHDRIELRYDADSLAKSGMSAPYELRDLRLVNQADMSLLERRERALTLAD